MSGDRLDDPNREAVGLDPIWTGAGASQSSTSDGYDPSEHTVADVEAYVADHPDELDAIVTAERAGKNRSTLLAALGAE